VNQRNAIRNQETKTPPTTIGDGALNN
jgi:hypothetical protein